MTKDASEKTMFDYVRVCAREQHAEAAKALGLAMLADAIKSAFGGEKLDMKGAVEHVKSDRLQRLVQKQTDDVGLWSEAITAPEKYLQSALRELHEAIESKMPKVECAPITKKVCTEEDIDKVERWFLSLDEADQGEAQESLDETVHDLYANLASLINNSALREQIEFVFEQCGDKAWDVFGRTWDKWEWE